MKSRVVTLLIVSLLFGQGCYTLRKKFIRKKKQQEEPTVYINFKEYPQKPTKEVYQDYYLFVEGWLDELIQSLEEGGNRKKQKQAIKEAIVNFKQILYFLNEEGRKQVGYLYQELLKIEKQLTSPYFNETKASQIARKVEYIKREFSRKLRWSQVSLWMD
ncbi:MAG: hypothetical protein J7K71_03730 [Candidatus Omnitrophica bacterium]|nr:hypothetical protein [Candidatus Omnitrophota bacterium]